VDDVPPSIVWVFKVTSDRPASDDRVACECPASHDRTGPATTGDGRRESSLSTPTASVVENRVE
jgi:hypothetical protein